MRFGCTMMKATTAWGHDRIIALRNNKTVFRDGDKVLKVFDGSFKESEVLSEALNQARVEETGLPVPSVREVTLTDGRWTIVTEYIKGKTLGALMAEQRSGAESISRGSLIFSSKYTQSAVRSLFVSAIR